MEKLIPIILDNLKNYPFVIAILAIFLFLGYILSFDGIAWYECIGLFVVCILVILFFAYMQFRSHKNRILEISNEVSIENLKINKLFNSLSRNKRNEICKVLQEASRKFAAALDFPGYYIRSNLFFINKKKKLRIFKDCCHNMKHLREFDLSIDIDEGCTGKCYKTGRIQLAIKVLQRQEEWGDRVLNNYNMDLINPDLKWIVSIPIMDKDRNVLCIMNVDGIVEDVDRLKIEEFSREILPKYATMIYCIIVEQLKH